MIYIHVQSFSVRKLENNNTSSNKLLPAFCSPFLCLGFQPPQDPGAPAGALRWWEPFRLGRWTSRCCGSAGAAHRDVSFVADIGRWAQWIGMGMSMEFWVGFDGILDFDGCLLTGSREIFLRISSIFPPGLGWHHPPIVRGPHMSLWYIIWPCPKMIKHGAWAPQVMAKESDLESRTFLGIPSTCSMKSGKVVWGYHPVVQLVWEENFLEGYHSLLQWTNPAGGYFLTSK